MFLFYRFIADAHHCRWQRFTLLTLSPSPHPPPPPPSPVASDRMNLEALRSKVPQWEVALTKGCTPPHSPTLAPVLDLEAGDVDGDGCRATVDAPLPSQRALRLLPPVTTSGLLATPCVQSCSAIGRVNGRGECPQLLLARVGDASRSVVPCLSTCLCLCCFLVTCVR